MQEYWLAVNGSATLGWLLLGATIICIVAFVGLGLVGIFRRKIGRKRDLRRNVNVVATIIAVCATVISFWLGSATFGQANDATTFAAHLKALLLVLWIVLPPVSLLFEYVFLAPDTEDTEDNFDRFKYEQDLKAKLWLANATVMTVIFFGKDLWKM